MSKAKPATKSRKRRIVPRDAVATRRRVLDTAMNTIRTNGLAGTSVDDVCAAAGVTKGTFFHYFKSKQAMAIAAAEHFATMADSLFAVAPYQQIEDPFDRLLGYIDFRRSILRGPLAQFTCLLGTMVQEAYDSNPPVRKACEKHICAHAAQVSKMIADAKVKYVPVADFDSESLGLYTQAALQGAFILAKATHGSAAAEDVVTHLRRYIELLFNRPPTAT